MELLGFFSVSEELLLLLVTLVASYWYMTRKYGMWEKQGVPEVRQTLVLGGLVSLLRKFPGDVEKERYKKYGRLYGNYEGNMPHLSVAEPDLIKDVMVKDFHVFHSRQNISTGDRILDLMLGVQKGESWKRVRSIISPTFTSGKLRMMSPLIQDIIERFVPIILEDAEHDTDVNFLKRYYQLILPVIAHCVFGTKIENMTDDNHPFVVNSRKIFSPSASFRFIFKRFFPKITDFLKIGLFPSDAMDYIKDLAVTIMQQRQQMKHKGNDFLQLIMDAQEGTLDMTQEDQVEQSHFDVGVGEAMPMKSTTSKKKFASEDEAIAQCVLFLVAGVDATAITLAYISYDLALHPECQDKLIEEVDAFWKRTKGELDLTELNRLPYLESIISESFRHHSIVPRIERVAQEDYVMGEKGIHIPKGTLVTIPVSAINHDPEWFPEPEKFDPERFSPENRQTINPYTFMPFGGGPRNCIANRFALLQIKLCLVHLLKRIRFHRSAQTKVPLEMRRAAQGVFPKSVVLSIEKRNTAR